MKEGEAIIYFSKTAATPVGPRCRDIKGNLEVGQ